MKSQFILFFVCVLIFSCNNPQTAIEEVEEFEEYFEPKFITDFSTKECQDQIEKAKRDFQSGKLVHQISIRNRFDEELEELLNEFNIGYFYQVEMCLPIQECYGWYMESLISNKYGKNFIEELEEKADSLFLARWETKTYDYWDIDKDPKYSEFHGAADKYIKSQVQLPIGWDSIPMKFERQFISVWVKIDKDGLLEKWEYDLHNLKDTNQKFLTNLTRQVDGILEKMTKWEPGVLAGRNVSANYLIDVNLDQDH